MGILDLLGLASKTNNIQEYVQKEAIILDVRTIEEYNGGHIIGSKNIALQILTNEISEILTRAKERGLVKMSVDTKLAAVFIQGYTFGKIVDDTSNAPVDSNDWTDWIMSILEYKILS